MDKSQKRIPLYKEYIGEHLTYRIFASCVEINKTSFWGEGFAEVIRKSHAFEDRDVFEFEMPFAESPEAIIDFIEDFLKNRTSDLFQDDTIFCGKGNNTTIERVTHESDLALESTLRRIRAQYGQQD